MEQTWRWYGPDDPVSLQDIRQAGATGVVTALHAIANGDVWPCDAINARKALIQSHELDWSVVESVPVHEDIKTRTGQYQRWIENYQATLSNLAQCGIYTVCYNFMPVLDWTRTDLSYELPDGSRALRFDQTAFAAFDLFILAREGAQNDYSGKDIRDAQAYYSRLSVAERHQLTQNIIAGLPGAEEGYTLSQFRQHLARYAAIDRAKLRLHLKLFLEAILPTCEQHGIKLAIHPDDPPRSILGLPRIVSTADDIEWLTTEMPSLSNGITMCTGSYGVRGDNELVEMIEQYGHRIYFAHLRSTQRDENNPLTFHEAAHLHGDVDMYSVVKALLEQERHRQLHGQAQQIPIRPDHGHQIIDDLHKQTNPGYSCIGRLKGLAELRGLELGIKRALFQDNDR